MTRFQVKRRCRLTSGATLGTSDRNEGCTLCTGAVEEGINQIGAGTPVLKPYRMFDFVSKLVSRSQKWDAWCDTVGYGHYRYLVDQGGWGDGPILPSKFHCVVGMHKVQLKPSLR